MNLFKGLIICKNCGKKFNFKNDHGQLIYVCSGYKNYGSTFCPRNVIREEDLIDLVKLHLSDKHKKLILREDIEGMIDRIEVYGEHISIFYKDGSKSEWNNSYLSI